MQYLTLRWFTLSRFDSKKLKIFHSLERSLKAVSKKQKGLCWYKQTENYLKQEFKNILLSNKNTEKIKLENFDRNLQNFLKQNKLDSNSFITNIDFMQKCDDIICHKTYVNETHHDIITSLP